MSVNTDTASITYSGNASTVTPYVVPFRFLKDAYLTVTVTPPTGDPTVLTLGAGYSVQGANGLTGGSIRTTAAWASTHTLTIERSMPLIQPYVYAEAQRLPLEVIESNFDWVMLAVQQAFSKVKASTILFPPNESSATNRTLPANSGRKETLLGFDSSGGVVVRTAAQVLNFLGITSLANYVTACAASAAQAAAAAAAAAASAAAAEVNVASENITYVLAIGQSNMQRGGGGPANYYSLASSNTKVDFRVMILNDAGAYVPWDLSIITQSSYLGNKNLTNTSGVSTIPYHFAKQFAKSTGQAVCVAGSARDGQSLDWWGVNQAGTALNTTAEGWLRIVACLAAMPRVDAILYHQGETRNGRDQAQQLAGMKMLFNSIIATGRATADTPILLGELAQKDLEISNLSMKQLAADPAWSQVRFVNSPKGTLIDSVHFSDNQIRDFGFEYCRKYIESKVSLRELAGGDSFLGSITTTYASGNQTQCRISVSSVNAGTNGRVKLRVLMVQGQIASRPACEFDLIVNFSALGSVWDASVTSGAGIGGLGVAVNLENKTAITADVVLHFTNPGLGAAYWAISAVIVRNIQESELPPPCSELTCGALVGEPELLPIYLPNGGGISRLNTSGILPICPRLNTPYSTNYKKIRISVKTNPVETMLMTLRFEGYLTRLGGPPLAVLADILISYYSGAAGIGAKGCKIGGLGINCATENVTGTGFDVVIRLVHPAGGPTTFIQDFGVSIVRETMADQNETFLKFQKNESSATVVTQPETDALYLPGGAGISAF
jgi:Carbohydrate esterase, sialic acid-specific acetylesterase